MNVPVRRIEDLPTDRPVIVCYVRVSKEEQRLGHGPVRQRELNAAWLSRTSQAPDGLFEDLGLSAFHGEHLKRGEFGRFMDALRRGRIRPGSVLALENIDRLSRLKALQGIMLLGEILQAGVSIVTTDDGFVYADEGPSQQRTMNLLLSLMQLGRSHSESDTKSDRLTSVWEAKAAKARTDLTPHGSRCPAWSGLSADRRTYELNLERQRILKDIFRWAAEGLGKRAIAKRLIKNNVEPWSPPSERRQAPVWNDSYVAKILRGREVLGDYAPTSKGQELEPIKDYYPRAITIAEWRAAQVALDSRRGSGGRKGEMSNLLQGLCQCFHCGGGMTILNKGERSPELKLVCRREQLGACENTHRYRYAQTEAGVIYSLKGAADALLAKTAEHTEDLRNKLAEQEEALADVRASIERVIKRIMEIDDPGLTKALEDCRTSETLHKNEIASMNERIRAAEIGQGGSSSPHSIVAFYERLSLIPKAERPAARLEVNQRLREQIEAISFDSEGHGVIRFKNGALGAEFWQSPSPRPTGNKGSFTSELGSDGKQLRGFEAVRSRAFDKV